jgi:hypothetical protein
MNRRAHPTNFFAGKLYKIEVRREDGSAAAANDNLRRVDLNHSTVEQIHDEWLEGFATDELQQSLFKLFSSHARIPSVWGDGFIVPRPGGPHIFAVKLVRSNSGETNEAAPPKTTIGAGISITRPSKNSTSLR